VLPERLRNRVLRRLAQLDRVVFGRFSDQLEPVPLEPGADLVTPRDAGGWVYFVEAGAISIVASTGGRSIEVAIVGREGAAGIGDALGSRRLPYRLAVQLPGLAYRAPSALVREHIRTCSALHLLLMEYSQFMMHQLVQSVLCSRFHTSVERLARWLLLTAERAGTNRFELTHQSVAAMVGAPRSTVSGAAAALRRQRTIDYRRGVLTVLDVARLQRASCECFAAISRRFDDGM
jgi:CRP-like cAMP-binding protein